MAHTKHPRKLRFETVPVAEVLASTRKKKSAVKVYFKREPYATRVVESPKPPPPDVRLGEPRERRLR
jgi:hypothetical protein